MKDSLAVIWSIGRKDLLLELRNKDVVVAVAGFALLILMIFTFSLNVTQDNAKLVGPHNRHELYNHPFPHANQFLNQVCKAVSR